MPHFYFRSTALTICASQFVARMRFSTQSRCCCPLQLLCLPICTECTDAFLHVLRLLTLAKQHHTYLLLNVNTLTAFERPRRVRVCGSKNVVSLTTGVLRFLSREEIARLPSHHWTLKVTHTLQPASEESPSRYEHHQ